MTVSRIALAAMSLLCGGGITIQSPTYAQQPLAAPRTLNVTRDEQVALYALQAAAAGPDRAAQDAALAAARNAASSNEARYAVAQSQIVIARARGDAQMLGQAVDALISSGLATSEEMPTLLANQAARAYQAAEYQRAERLIRRAVELDPNNAALLADHAQIRSQEGQALLRDTRRASESRAAFTEAVDLLQRAIQVQQATGRMVPQSWYLRALALANDTRLAPQATALGHGLVSTFPSPLNWRDALLTYRQLAAAGDSALDLDIRRLQRAAGALAGEKEYLETAQALRASSPGEAKAVLDEGVSRGMLEASEAQVRAAITAATRPATTERTGLARLRTQATAATGTGAQARAAGDAHFGNGQYAAAAELYRAALQKGGEDTNLVNTRLGAALALAGQRAEAEAAFRSVTGPRADLAGFWLAWLARRPM
jgi:tetratricopeptide (TPR) repeat protein